MSARPFEGVRILDFTQVLAGPFASYQLALLGAEVVKVERREGEDMRRTPLSREWAERGMASAWQAVNGNKRSLTLDLQKPEAREILLRLAAEADVVMENFRPGVMDRLGLGYEALSKVNPRLIFCSVSAFGQTGPDRLEAGYDGRIQAMSGIMAMTGHPGGDPLRAGFAVCDQLSGMTAAFAVASALFQRTHTGQGQRLDVSMLESTLAFLGGQVADWTVAGHQQRPWGNQAVSRKATANLFRARDGHLLLAVNTDKQYESLMRAIGRADALEEPRLADWFLRLENAALLREVIEGALAAGDAAEWEERLNAAGAPCARIWRVDEVIEHRQIRARDALQEVETPWGRLRFATTGFRMAHGGARLDRPAPALGADTEAVLAAAGYDAARIAAFREAGVI
ncbi:CoA transferase [Belnapia sp. T6]|uniref:CoA transferase n=1 Tax=Belnapia mucosa TaxID=2804532 RepID=A0ABS1UXN5_9PROT|nr:CoA transferase [Belnapia mucosa]MBL6454160.1 CoA transferase [Belnapia mucosa]